MKTSITFDGKLEPLLLNIDNLSITFGSGENKHTAVSGVSLELKQGDSLGIVGESGSGKSLTALSIMRLLPTQATIASGSIRFFDEDLLTTSKTNLRKIRGQRISMIFQEPMTSLNPVMRCGRQVTEILIRHQKMSVKEARKQTLELFEKVRLPRVEDIYRAYPHQVSGGQKQRVMIAMAVANKPELLIADEPTTALDVTVQKEIINLLNSLQEEFGMGLLFISHDLAVVSQVVRNVAVMYRGEIVEQGSSADLFSHPQHPYTRGLLACRPPLHGRPERLPTLDEFMQTKKVASDGKPSRVAGKRMATHQQLYANEPLLKVEDLEKKYTLKKSFLGKKKEYLHAVDRVSLEVYPGETLGLVGVSGCGKTTLGRSILRLIEPDGGRIYFDEKDLLLYHAGQLKKARRQLNIIFQDPYSSLNPRMSIGQAIIEPMVVHGIGKSGRERRKLAMELLEKVGLQETHFYRYPHEFSGGQRQRIVIARALSLNPRFIICDEAVSALDVSVQARVLNLLNDLKKEFRFTYIFISHDLSVVRYMSDRIMVMKDGKIVEAGDADDICDHPQTEYTKQLISSIPTFA
ncbi:MAG: ABC transporter ATP-binding protein [bacterium]